MINQFEISIAIENFRQLLSVGYEFVKSSYEEYQKESEFVVSFEDFFSDWAQANWQLLVERVICSARESIQIYGSGSDYEAASHSRVFYHDAMPTHNIICCSNSKPIDLLTQQEVDLSMYEFEAFVSYEKEWFEITPPFNHILLFERNVTESNYRQIVIPSDNIEWQVYSVLSKGN